MRIKGDSVAKLSDRNRSEIRNEYIGFVFQNFNLVPVLSALENVMLPLQLQGVSKKQAREKALSLLEEVELSDRLDHRPQKLSGGQQQRVAIARALVTDPLLVIADEPTANLDTRSANLIVNLMRKINESRGAAFVFSTHDDRLLDRVDRKIHLLDGAVEEDTGDPGARSAQSEVGVPSAPPAELQTAAVTDGKELPRTTETQMESGKIGPPAGPENAGPPQSPGAPVGKIAEAGIEVADKSTPGERPRASSPDVMASTPPPPQPPGDSSGQP